MKTPKYEYHLKTWGGFYNPQYQKIHGHKEGDFWFDTNEERSNYIAELKKIAKELNANYLMIDLTEGFCCRIRTVLHRVVEWQGKQYYSYNDLGINYPFSVAKYHLEYKWTCGFNDYPLGDDFDYENNPPTIIKEWITGADQEMFFER